MRLAATVSVVLVLLVSSATLCPASGSADRSLSPYFVVEGADDGSEPLPLARTDVRLDVAGVIAEVVVRQTYRNRGDRPINARYVFPASTRAAVHGMTMRVGRREIRAQIKERQQARKRYEKARRQGKRASLLEQQRPNVFTMQVANIMPGDNVQVELRYSELVVPQEGIYEVVYPTVVGPRYTKTGAKSWTHSPYTRAGRPPRSRFAFSGRLSGGVPIARVTSPSHTIKARWERPNLVRLSLAGESGGNRDLVLRYRLSGKQIQTGLLLARGDQENFFALLVQPPKQVREAQIPPREYVFILDVSGSMHGFPLDTAKVLIKRLIARLRPSDRFNVLLFSGGSQLMAPQSVPATSEQLANAVALVDRQDGGGGTELLPALQRAMSLPLTGDWARTFVLVTDGYVAVDDAAHAYVRSHLGQANVFAFGIGSSVNRHLIEGLARAGQGEPFVVLNRQQAAESVERFARYLAAPVLTNIRLRFEGFEAYDLEPAGIPDAFVQRPIIVRGKWRGSVAGKIVLEGITGVGSHRQVVPVSDQAFDEAHRGLRYLWARSRIARLADALSGDQAESAKARITSLGLRYNLLTRFTSFVAVEKRIANRSSSAGGVDQPLPMPQGVSDRAVGMSVGSEPPLGLLFALVGCCLAMTLVLRNRRGSTGDFR